MDKKAIFAGLSLALMLHACKRKVGPAPAEPSPTATASASPSPASPDVGESDRDLTPALTPEAERGAEGARNVLLSFAGAIEREEFGRAWAMLSPNDRQKWPEAEFARRFEGLSEISLAVPDGTIEGACGSSYYTAPIALTARDRAGHPVRYEGEAVLRRVNDIDGATSDQLRWHFERLTIDRAR